MPKSRRKFKIHFFYSTKKFQYPRNSLLLKKFIEKIFILEGVHLKNLNYVFCDDKELLAINVQYLDHNYYTDIITFVLSEKTELIQGESYISIDRVKENSDSMNIPFGKELLRVMFHGALHLCGYNDKTKEDALLMRKKEDFYLSLYNN
ncbi:MAG: rRNA maturation RNase YbeY [Bacteroidetes bacterium]|nr:rRNA maturation RNase YbeY [Bacteroidota bacterium]MBS1929870.1 rRNA maturation RNase YbeY [Bacteroidota bacterium]